MPDKYDDFTASHIFTTDEEGNTIYTRDGIDYIVNDPKQQHVTQRTSVPRTASEKPLLQKVHEIIADYNLFHLIMFLIIAAPFLYFIYAMIKASLTD